VKLEKLAATFLAQMLKESDEIPAGDGGLSKLLEIFLNL
jgi:hypothetical protein